MRQTNKGTKQTQPQKRAAKAAVSNAVTLDPNNPIPFDYTGRSIAFVNKQQYLPFVGTDNQYAQKICSFFILANAIRCIFFTPPLMPQL